MTGHYDPNQPRNKGGEWTGGGGKSGATTDTKGSGKVWPDKHPEGPEVRDVHVLQAADAAGVKNNKVRLALLDAHEKGHIKTHAELSKIAQHIAEHGDHEGTAVTAINVHGGGGGDYRVRLDHAPKLSGFYCRRSAKASCAKPSPNPTGGGARARLCD